MYKWIYHYIGIRHPYRVRFTNEWNVQVDLKSIVRRPFTNCKELTDITISPKQIRVLDSIGPAWLNTSRREEEVRTR